MCGIAGEYGQHRPDEAIRMLARLEHRGPDDQGGVRVNGSWLGHTRLSIVDVDGGRQPLTTPGRDLFLVGNGEVYNHEQVRATLDDSDYSTRSDNEVALHLIAQRGPDALGELEGMFAFLVAGMDGSFVAARDPVGIKPLYWARRGSHVRFASEMHAFDPHWMPYVEPFPPGFFWTPKEGLQRFARAVPDRDPPPNTDEPWTDADLERVRNVLIASVRRQLMGDVPVGVFLSGGLDSTLIAAIAARELSEKGETLQTFAVGTEDSPDVAAARVAAKHIGSEHRERIYTQGRALNTVEAVVRSIEHFDPSLVRSAVPNYLLSEMTARHVKVVLTGEGADELFAGYEYLREIEDPHELHDELERTVSSLHNLNLQRADRVTMAHGLEARVPFLDREVIGLALDLPATWKIPDGDHQEKQLLREAFAGWLPDELLWREKAQFGDGSGAADVLTDELSDRVSQEEFEAEKDSLDPPLRTLEELHYFRVFSEHLPGIRPEQTVARFATA